MKPRIRIHDGHWWVKVPGEINERFAGKVANFQLREIVSFALEFMKVPY